MDESTPLPGLGPRAQQSSINSALGPSPLSTTIVHVEHQAGANNPPEQQLPPLLGILDIFLRQNETGRFFSETSSLNDVQFSGQRPIVGVGHHFVVYASPFSKLDTVPDRAAKVGAEVFCIKSPNMTSRTEEEGFRNEYYHTVLQELRVMTHPDLVDDENIIGLLGLDFQEDYDDFKLAWPLLLMEYAEFGTLDAFQHDSNGLQPELSRNLLLDVALGLRSLHSCNIIHGDVKSENVLVCGHSTRQYVAKLSDFGLAVVNPSKEKKHYLPGCTWLWSAPEARDELSVHGMQLTDVYSFGLTVWRVLLNCDDPFEWIARSTTTIYNQHNFVDQIKSNIAFPQMILQTFSDLRQQNPAPLFAGPVITSTLSLDPSQRDIEAAILVLSEGSTTRGKDVFSDHQLNNQASWDLETPEAVMTTLADAFPWEITKCFMARPSVFYLLIQDLEIVMSWNSTTSLLAANLCFEIIISPQIQIGDKGVKNSSRLLSRLCELGSQAHRSIAHLYCKLNQTEFRGNFDLSWLEDTVWQGSYFAIQTLQTDFPDRYLEWKSAVEGDASRECLGSAEDYQRMLIAYCRTGNIKQCHAMLDAGASAFTDWDEPGPLHFLAMSNDAQAPAVASRLIDAGAALDHWEGNHSDDILLFDKPSGTPLHWAVWHRNLPLIRVLTERDYHPDEENAKRAVLVAAAMYLYDALEILLDWITIRNPKILSSEWITSLLSTATVHVLYHLPRFLRHGNKVSIAMSQTFEQLLQIHAPPTAELITSAGLVSIAAIQNHAELFRYLIVRFELYATKNGSRETFESIHANCLMSGFIDIFDILYEHRFFPLDHLFGTDKFTGMQVCLAVRQRNLYFIGRFLEWGCPVDGMGVGTVAEWTPFAMAVQCGLYDIANLLLQHGANKEFTTGWLGGTTPLFRMLHSWPDVPISRVKYLLQEVPRQGFGHVSFIGWPANGANVLYSFAMAVWSHYRSSYKFTETMKYVLSMMADKSCLNTLDRTGCTALNMAARSGNLEVARTLIEAGADVNGGLAISPLNAAMDWREKWVKKEREAMGRSVVGERRHATKIRMRAEELIQLLRMNGARERGFMENQRMMISTVTSGNFKLPSAEMLFECMSALIDRSTTVNQGSIKLHPTKKDDFTAHRGIENATQKAFRGFGRFIDQNFGGLGTLSPTGLKRDTNPPPNQIVARYQPHSCYPWHPCPFANGPPTQGYISAYKPPSPGHDSPSAHSPRTPDLPTQNENRWNSSASTLNSSPTHLVTGWQLPMLPSRQQPRLQQSPESPSSPAYTQSSLPDTNPFHLRTPVSPSSAINQPLKRVTSGQNYWHQSPQSSQTHGSTLPGMPDMHLSSTVYPPHSTPPTASPPALSPSNPWFRRVAQQPPPQTPWSPSTQLPQTPWPPSTQPPTQSPIPSSPPPPPRRGSASVIQSLQTAITALHNPPDNSDLYETGTPPSSVRTQSLELLRREFAQPVQLLYRADHMGECIDFAEIESVVLEGLGREVMRGISLVPELGDGGRELWIYVFGEEVEGKGVDGS